MLEDLRARISIDATVNLNERIGRRIQDMRKSMNITQEQLSEALGISIKHMSSVERGLSSLSLERLIDISFVLDCSLDYLILGENSKDAASKLPQYVIEVLNRNDRKEEKLLSEYLHMYKMLRND